MLSKNQIEALNNIAHSTKGYLWVGEASTIGVERASRAVSASTAASLVKLGLVKSHKGSGFRSQGIGCWVCYKVTAEGKELILIGRMLSKLF